jgi:hypothetical protein
MRLFQKLLVIGALAMAAACPALAQQGQQQAPMMGQGGMMGGDNKGTTQGGMMRGGQGGMMGQSQGGMIGGDNKPSTQGGMMGGPGGDQGGMMGQGQGGMMGGMMGGKGGMMTVPMMEGRLAYLKADLEITPAQEQAWNAYADAVRARHTAMQSIHEDMAKAMESGNVVDRMDARIKALEARVDSLKALKPPTQALYAVLTDLQKKEADRLLGGGCGMN